MKVYVVEIKNIGLSAIRENKYLREIGFVPNKNDRLIIEDRLETKEFIVECINYDLVNNRVVVFVRSDEKYFKNNMKDIIIKQ